MTAVGHLGPDRTLVAIKASADGETWAVVVGGHRIVGTPRDLVSAGALVAEVLASLGPLAEALLRRQGDRSNGLRAAV